MAGSSAGSVFVDLLLKDAKYQEGLRRAKTSTKQASIDITSALKSVAGAFAASFSVNELIKYSDQYKQLQGRLKLVTNSASELAAVQERLFSIAQNTRTDLSATVTLYQRLSSATKGLGISQEEIFTFTEQLNKQLITAGVASSEASAAILQLTQAFNKGKLDGDEFKSILENAPPILEALTTSLGVTKEEIYELSKAGKLGPRQLIDAVNGMAIVTNKRFKDFEITVSQAFTQLNNAVLDYVGNSDLVNSASKVIADSISDLSKFITDASKEGGILVFSLSRITEAFLEFARVYTENSIRIAEATNFFGIRQEAVDDYKRKLEDIIMAQNQFYDKRQEMLNGSNNINLPQQTVGNVPPPVVDTKAQEKAVKELNNLYNQHRGLIQGVDDATLKYRDTIDDLNKLLETGKITQEEYNGAVYRAQEEFDKAREKGQQFAFDVEAATKRAAENIQDSFADFLFDPFDKGLKGMLKGFVDTIRRMVAEAQSAKILTSLFGNGSDISGLFSGGIFGSSASTPASGIGPSKPATGLFSLFDGFFADGGYISPGHFGVAGEAGAELIYGGKTGATVFNQDQVGRGNVYNIDARGADQAAVTRLEQSLLTLAGPGVIEQRVGNAQMRGVL